MKRFASLFFRFWRPAAIIIVLTLLAYLLFFRNIGQIPHGYTTRERDVYQLSDSWHDVVSKPTNAPYKLGVWALVAIGQHSLIDTRLIAATFAVIVCFLFFMVAQSWFSYRTAFLTTIMFASSSGFLHVARLGSTIILQTTALLALLAVGVWRRHTTKPVFASYIIVLLLGLTLYVPGIIWLDIAALAFIFPGIRHAYGNARIKHRIFWPLLPLLLISPLILASFRSPSLLLTIAGLPNHFTTIGQIMSNVAYSFLSIGIRSNGGADLWVGHAPLLNIVELVLLILGVYNLVVAKRSKGGTFLLVIGLISIVLIGLGGPVNISSLVPILYLFIGAGLFDLLHQWFFVFPRNPIARYGGVGLVGIMVFFSVLYQVRAYYVAWPNNNATKQTFTISAKQ